MKLSKKLLSLLLCAVMVLGSVAVGGEGFAEILDAVIVRASAAKYIDMTPDEAAQWASTHVWDCTYDYDGSNLSSYYGEPQCVDWFRMYTTVCLGINTGSISGTGVNGQSLQGYASEIPFMVSVNNNFTVINGGTPRKGDIFVVSGTPGHVGVVIDVYSNGSFQVADVNYVAKNTPGKYTRNAGQFNYLIRPNFKQPHTHSYDYSASIIKAPTSSSTGTRRCYCSCGTYTDRTIPAIPYTTDLAEGVYVIKSKANSNVVIATNSDSGYNAFVANFESAWSDQYWILNKNSDGTYCFENLINNGYVLDVYDNSMVNLGNIVTYPRKTENYENERFYIVPSGSYYKFVNKRSYNVIDCELTNGSVVAGNNIIQYEDNGGNNQLWSLTLANPSLSVSSSSFSVTPGSTNTINCTVSREMKGHTIAYSVSNSNICSVSKGNWNGMTLPITITGGKTSGTATVTLTLKDSDTGVVFNTKTINVTVPDSTKPTGSISSTNNVASSQTVTLSMSDNAGIAGYYWGTSSSYSSNTYTAVSGTSKAVTKTVSSNGTYYLTVKDTSGNISSTVSKTFYKTTLNANGGSVSPASVITMSGNSFTLPTTTRSGYSYKNWNTVSDGSGTSYTGSYKPTGNVTLYAQWTPNTYTVSYNANGGSGVPSNQTKTYGTTLTLSSTKPTREGYTFLGWAETSTATTAAYQAGGSFTKDANTTLYAVWNKNAATYTVKYDANGGSGAPASQTKIEGTTLALSSTKPTRTGYTFKNWNTKADGTGTSYSSGASYTANAAVTLYAQWTENHTHNYTKSVTKPTCTQQGYTTYTCSCGETYKSDYVSALDHNYVNGICTGCGDISSEYSLAEAKQIAKSELETARNNAISNEAKGILDFAIITVDSAASIDEVNNIKANAIKAANDADASYFNDNKLNNANINIASEKNFDYRSIVTITATATNVPEGYKLALYVNGSKVAEGDNKSVSYSVGELKSNVNYSVKVLDNNGNVQKDSNGNELSKDSKITVNAGFFKKLIAFFKGLFKSLPKVEVKP